MAENLPKKQKKVKRVPKHPRDFISFSPDDETSRQVEFLKERWGTVNRSNVVRRAIERAYNEERSRNV